MIVLTVNTEMMTHTLNYGRDRDMADAELDILRSRMEEKYSNDSRTHKIDCPVGPVVVDINRVLVARIIDTDVDRELYAAEIEERDTLAIERDLRHRRALQAAGFDRENAPVPEREG